MKKILGLLLALCALFGCVSCGASVNTPTAAEMRATLKNGGLEVTEYTTTEDIQRFLSADDVTTLGVTTVLRANDATDGWYDRAVVIFCDSKEAADYVEADLQEILERRLAALEQAKIEYEQALKELEEGEALPVPASKDILGLDIDSSYIVKRIGNAVVIGQKDYVNLL